VRVLILNYEYPPLGGGAAQATREILSCFKKTSKLLIDLVTSSRGVFSSEKLTAQITVHRLNIGKGDNLHYQSNRELLCFTEKALKYCRSLLKEYSYDLVHAFFGIPCGYIARKLKLPYIVSLRGSDVPFYNPRFRIPDKLLFRTISHRIWKEAAFVVPNSTGLKKLARRTAPELSMPVIPNGVNTAYFFPLKKKTHSKSLQIISTGRLISRKGYADLIQALQGVKGITLTLAGHGNLRKQLERQAAGLSVPCQFTGPVDRDAVRNLLQSNDLFVLPSLNEGMSNSILEAMACGLPIIATDTGGSAELITDNGIIVPKQDIQALRRAILFFRDSREMLLSCGTKSRTIAQSMAWEKIARQYLELYNKTASWRTEE